MPQVDQQTLLIACFGAGALLQAIALMRMNWRWARLGGCLALALLAFLPGKHEVHYDPYLHELLYIGVFAFFFAVFFKDQVLPVVTEKILLSYTLVFWFAFFSFFYRGTAADNVAAALLLLVGTAVVCVTLSRPTLSFTWKLVSYGWFLTCLVCIGLLQFPFRHLGLFLSPTTMPWLTPGESVASGMAFLFLAVNLVYLYLLIPIPSRNQSFADRMKEWHQLTDQMTHRFVDVRPSWNQGLVIVGAEGGALLLVYLYHWVPGALAVNLLVILPGLVQLAGSRSPETAAVLTDEHAAHGISTQKTGRNDLCPCGSGRKFKFCHGR